MIVKNKEALLTTLLFGEAVKRAIKLGVFLTVFFYV